MIKLSQNFNSAINLTGYRLLLILQLLMQGPVSKYDILHAIQENEYVKDISQDTIRLDINTLKNAGFEITKSLINDTYFYILKTNPLEIKLTKDDIKTIEEIKKIALDLWNWKNIISLYETLEKVCNFINNEEYKNTILNFGYFMQIDFNLLKELHNHCLKNNEIVLSYNSPKNGPMPIRMRVIDIEHNKDTNKLHLLGQLEHYNYISYLRVDKILKIEKVFLRPTIELIEKKYREYKIKNIPDFEPGFNEEIIETTPHYLRIKTTVINDFQYIQRILNLGDNILEIDKETKSNILENLNKTIEVYK